MKQKNIDYTYKICALKLKYQTDILEKISFDGNIFKLGSTDILSVKTENRLVVEKIETADKKLRITGNTHFGMFRKHLDLGMVDKKSGAYFECSLIHRPEYDVYGILEDKIRAKREYDRQYRRPGKKYFDHI